MSESSGRPHIPHYTGHVRSFVKHSVNAPVAFTAHNRHSNTIQLNNNENINTTQSMYNSTMIQLPIDKSVIQHQQFAKQACIGESLIDATNSIQSVNPKHLWKSTYNHVHNESQYRHTESHNINDNINVAESLQCNDKLCTRGVNQLYTSYDLDYGRALDQRQHRSNQLNNLASTITHINTDKQYNNILSTQADIHHGTSKDINNVNARFDIPVQYTGHHPINNRNKAKFTGNRAPMLTSII